jgi:hypothetical protein
MFTKKQSESKDSIKIEDGQYIKVKRIVRNSNVIAVDRIRWNPIRKLNTMDTIDSFIVLFDNVADSTKIIPEPGPRVRDWTTYKMAVQLNLMFGWGKNEMDSQRKYLWQPLVVRFDNRDNKSGSLLDIVSEMHWLAYFNLEPAMSF